MNDANARAMLRRIGDQARQLGYHSNQVRIVANEILDLVGQLEDHLDDRRRQADPPTA